MTLRTRRFGGKNYRKQMHVDTRSKVYEFIMNKDVCFFYIIKKSLII
jgi:spore cortex formation protein SpoVR/YcgB (stage V sporulation)